MYKWMVNMETDETQYIKFSNQVYLSSGGSGW